MEWYEILSFAIGIAGVLLGVAFSLKFKTALKLIAELGELLIFAGVLLTKTSEALKDRKVTKAEAVLLLKSWQEVVAQFAEVYRTLCQLIPASAIKFLFKK